MWDHSTQIMATGVDPDSQSGKILDGLGYALDNGGDTLGKHTETALNKLNDIVNQDGQKDDGQNFSQTGSNGEKSVHISTLTIFVIFLLPLVN